MERWLYLLVLLLFLAMIVGLVWMWRRHPVSYGILKVRAPIEGTVLATGGDESSWLEEFRRKKYGDTSDLLARYVKMYAENGGRTIVEYHFAPQCKWCHVMTPIYNQIVNEFMNGGGNTEYVLMSNDAAINTVPGIRLVPTVVRYDGTTMNLYHGPKNYESLKSWVLNPKS